MCSSRQSWTKYLRRSKEIKQNWSRAENFDSDSDSDSDFENFGSD